MMILTNNKTRLLILFLCFYILGCSSTIDGKRSEIVKQSINEIPDWYITLPQANTEDSNPEIMIAGTGVSYSLSLAKDKALLDIEKQLANKISAKVSSRFKQYIRELGNESALVIEDNEIVTKKLVTEAQVAGYEEVDTKIVNEHNNYRVYLLAKYPLEENFLRSMAKTEELIRQFSGDKEKAFNELDEEIREHR